MALKDQINEDIKTAMKAKDEAGLRALRAIKSAILLAETAEGQAGQPLSEETEIKILKQQVNMRKDAYEQFMKAGATDSAQKEKEEMEVIAKYLPAELSRDEIEAGVKAIIAETGATTVKDLGKVMKAANERFAGRADNKLVSELAKSLLGG
jgi:uncharacterized protein YqeY